MQSDEAKSGVQGPITMLNLAFTETQHKVLSDQYHANISYTISLLLIFV
jgi:hypothetical protein